MVPAESEIILMISWGQVSHELTRMLGSAYSPDAHWTSDLRTRNAHKQFVPMRNSEGKKKMYATFTLHDTTKMFTRYLAQSYPPAAQWMGKPPTYHLDVKTTRGDMSSEFSYDNDQVRMVSSQLGPSSILCVLFRT